jgi:hypothetical protein
MALVPLILDGCIREQECRPARSDGYDSRGRYDRPSPGPISPIPIPRVQGSRPREESQSPDGDDGFILSMKKRMRDYETSAGGAQRRKAGAKESIQSGKD